MRASSVTFLMSVYNGERWLNKCINSVLNQTFTDFEFIIVNDGSTDLSLQIINKYANSDPRIKVFNKENTGLSNSLNLGISKSKSKWIARIDADDLCEPDRLRIQYAMAKENPELVLIGSSLLIIDENDKVLQKYVYPTTHKQLKDRLINLGKGFFPHSSAFFLREKVIEIGCYREVFANAMDYDLWLRFSEKGKIGCTNIPLVRIRKHSAQMTNELSGKTQLIEARTALASHLLRQAGKQDPLAGHRSQMRKFKKIVQKTLLKKDFFFYHQSIQAWRNCHWPKIGSRAFWHVPIHLARFILSKIFGENIASRIAEDWSDHEVERIQK